MLKPKKKFTKKDIQRDPLLEFLNDLTINLKENRTRYIQILAGVVIAVVLVVVVSGRMSESTKLSDSQLGLALAALETGDVTGAQFQFENIVSNGSSDKSNYARYYLATIRYNSNDIAGAKSLLEEFIKGSANDILTPKGYLLLTTIYESEGSLDKALSTVDSGIKKSSNDFYTAALKIKKADLLFKQGKSAEAGELNRSILDNKKLDNSLRMKAEMLSGKLNG